jgi:hypothetical protein
MRIRLFFPATCVALLAIGAGWKAGVAHGRAATPTTTRVAGSPFDARIRANGDHMFEEGRRTFRFDTFGDKVYWSDALGLDRGNRR